LPLFAVERERLLELEKGTLLRGNRF
jgi:hypothetical protein